LILSKESFQIDSCSVLIKIAITEINSSKGIYFNESLGAIANLCLKHGEVLEYHTDIIGLINQSFRDGISKNLIHTLTELSKI